MSQDLALRTLGDEIPVGLFAHMLSEDPIADFRVAEELRALAPMPDTAQRLFDRVAVEVGLDRLTIVKDLLAAGLTYSLPNWLSVLELYWETQGRSGNAIRTMEPTAREERQLPQRSGKHMPVYCTLDRFSFGPRVLAASQRAGTPLDTTCVGQSIRTVNETIEDQAINGAGLQSGGFTAPGLLNAPNHGTFHYGSGEAWDAAAGGHSGEEILADVLAGIDVLQANRRFGPAHLWVPTTYGNRLNDDFKAFGATTIRQRLEQLIVGGRNLTINVADQLPDDTTILCEMTSDTIDVVVGQEPAVISWLDGAGMERFFMVLACLIVRPKDSYTGQSGIVIGTPS